MKIIVEAFWDDETEVWVASSAENIGLATEADTIEELREKISIMIPELLSPTMEGPFEIELIARSLYTVAAA